MSETFYTQVPYMKSHSHFTNNYIEAFPDLHAHDTFADRKKNIQEAIKYQVLTTKAEDAKRFINLRECFKFNERNIVQLCLKEKVPGTSFVEAAKELGYRKI